MAGKSVIASDGLGMEQRFAGNYEENSYIVKVFPVKEKNLRHLLYRYIMTQS